MANADIEFRCLCEDILENGISNEGQKVRTVWPDGTPAYTIAKFGVVQRYDLSKEYPVLTLRKSAIKSATDEMLWIFQKKSNRVSELGSHVWDQWADKEGTIGKAYGYQLGIKHRCKDVTEDGIRKAFPNAIRAEGRFDKDCIPQYDNLDSYGQALDHRIVEEYIDREMGEPRVVAYRFPYGPWLWTKSTRSSMIWLTSRFPDAS